MHFAFQKRRLTEIRKTGKQKMKFSAGKIHKFYTSTLSSKMDQRCRQTKTIANDFLTDCEWNPKEHFDWIK